MSFTRFEAWGVALVLSAGAARAADCAATYAECKEDCSLEYGSIRVEMKRRFAECVMRCEQESSRCLEEDSAGELADSPAPKKKKAKAKKKKRMAADGREIEDVQPAQRDALKNDDVPNSSQSTNKIDEKQVKEEKAPGKDEKLVPPSGASDAPRDQLAPLAKPPAGAPELEASKPEGEKAPLQR